jgi:hypothetical protein
MHPVISVHREMIAISVMDNARDATKVAVKENHATIAIRTENQEAIVMVVVDAMAAADVMTHAQDVAAMMVVVMPRENQIKAAILIRTKLQQQPQEHLPRKQKHLS